jgi:hypothetical protein
MFRWVKEFINEAEFYFLGILMISNVHKKLVRCN